MTDSERLNLLQALELRHDELLQSLTELDLRVEAVLGQLRPAPAPAPVPVADAAKPTSGQSKSRKLAA